jgi:hypothetical protein
MAEFGARAEATPEQPVTGNDRTADAGSDREHDHVADEPARAEAELGPACSVRVIVDDDRGTDAGLELLAERLVAPVDVRCVIHDRLCGIDEAGGGHTHCGDLLAVRE